MECERNTLDYLCEMIAIGAVSYVVIKIKQLWTIYAEERRDAKRREEAMDPAERKRRSKQTRSWDDVIDYACFKLCLYWLEVVVLYRAGKLIIQEMYQNYEEKRRRKRIVAQFQTQTRLGKKHKRSKSI